jgi:hypothetical protein
MVVREMPEADDEKKHARALLEILYLARDEKALKEVVQNPAQPQYVKDYAAGLLLRPWLPWGWLRRGLMLLISLASVALAFALHSATPLLLLLLNVFLSPRIVGETMAFLGSLRR